MVGTSRGTPTGGGLSLVHQGRDDCFAALTCSAVASRRTAPPRRASPTPRRHRKVPFGSRGNRSASHLAACALPIRQFPALHRRSNAMRTRAPAHLAAAGSRLWRAITDRYDLDPAELATLEAAARQADDVARLTAAAADAPVLDAGSTGQPRVHPVLVELRLSRQALAALLARLRLPTDDVDEGESPATTRARAAAERRWSNERTRRARRGVA